MQTRVTDPAYTTPIYGQGEAAQIIQAPPTSCLCGLTVIGSTHRAAPERFRTSLTG
jgi:hypothetical protein